MGDTVLCAERGGNWAMGDRVMYADAGEILCGWDTVLFAEIVGNLGVGDKVLCAER